MRISGRMYNESMLNYLVVHRLWQESLVGCLDTAHRQEDPIKVKQSCVNVADDLFSICDEVTEFVGVPRSLVCNNDTCGRSDPSTKMF